MAKRLTAKGIDKLVEQAFYRRCSGIQINVLDIGKVFRAGRDAATYVLADATLKLVPANLESAIEAAVVAEVEKLRKN